MNEVKLPKDWKTVKVGKYVISTKGKKPKRISKERTNEFHLPYVNIKAFEKGIIDEYTDGVGCVICEEGDFLMVWDGSRSGYVGKAIKGALGSTLVKLNFPDIDNNYAYYFLQSKYIEINTRAKGVGIPHVDPNLLWNYDLLIPPLETQQAIVSKIEELFSELDKGIEDLKTAQQQLKTYRQSVLKWAFEGKLTEEWRTNQLNLSSVEDLLANIKKDKHKLKTKPLPQITSDELDELFEIPKEWSWARNEEYLYEVKDGTHDTPKYISNGIPFITQKNIKDSGLTFNDIQYISEEEHIKFYQRSNPSRGDILISMIGHNRGMTAIVDNDEIFSIKNVGLFKFNTKLQNNKFSYYFYQSRIGLNIVLKKSKGGAQPFIGLTELRNWPVVVCSLEEQHLIVQEIESRLSVADKMEESIAQSLQQADALRQSILKKAFSGELV